MMPTTSKEPEMESGREHYEKGRELIRKFRNDEGKRLIAKAAELGCEEAGEYIRRNNIVIPAQERVNGSGGDPQRDENLVKAPGISRVALNLLCFIGVFVFGWLMVVVFARLGRSGTGWKYAIGVMALSSIVRDAMNPALILLPAMLYMAGWIHANVLLSEYESMARENAEPVERGKEPATA